MNELKRIRELAGILTEDHSQRMTTDELVDYIADEIYNEAIDRLHDSVSYESGAVVSGNMIDGFADSFLQEVKKKIAHKIKTEHMGME